MAQVPGDFLTGLLQSESCRSHLIVYLYLSFTLCMCTRVYACVQMYGHTYGGQRTTLSVIPQSQEHFIISTLLVVVVIIIIIITVILRQGLSVR